MTPSAPRPSTAPRYGSSMTRAIEESERERLAWVEYYKREAAERSAGQSPGADDGKA